ncbi:hypothetical protein [Aliikangiella sp. IMCC44359]|uniref:hypothetical protein n=1 Tax=Aliikangiella sp. IMCC44359 TaxID=3459125 RepID=UPI00403AA56E
MKRLSLILCIILLTSCGDFPDYHYDKTEDYCVLAFPFAGGFFGRKYVGYFYITSTLQYLDSDPEIEIFIGEPTHIDLEVGSVQKVEIGDQSFIPEFRKRYTQGEMQYWGPAFLFNKEQSTEMFKLLQDGNDPTIHGRLEIGKQYETSIYNFFFDSTEEPFRACINRLLNAEDLEKIKSKS